MFEKEADEYFETECLHSYADTEEQLKEDVTNEYPSFTIEGACYELRSVYTINTDWTYQEVKE